MGSLLKVMCLLVAPSFLACSEIPSQGTATYEIGMAVDDGLLGAGCKSDAECASGLACFANAGSRCLCRPGFTACDRQCVDLANDPDHCGGCDVTCAAAETCSKGACGFGTSVSTISPAVSVDPKTRISGVPPSGQCGAYNELFPQTASSSLVPLYAAYQRNISPYGLTNWATAWNAWSTNLNTLPVEAGYVVNGDP